MSNIGELPFIDTLPDSLSGDAQVQALAEAINLQLQQLPAQIGQALILPNVSKDEEAVLDALSWQLHIDAYQQSYAIDVKRALVRDAIRLHRILGTPAAIEELVGAIFGPGVTVEEWFDYGGDPYHFRLLVPDSLEGAPEQAAATLLILQAKNARSVFDGFVVLATESYTLHIGMALHGAAFGQIGG